MCVYMCVYIYICIYIYIYMYIPCRVSPFCRQRLWERWCYSLSGYAYRDTWENSTTNSTWAQTVLLGKQRECIPKCSGTLCKIPLCVCYHVRSPCDHSCHILPFQPSLRNRYSPSEPAKTTQSSPQSISEGGNIWRVRRCMLPRTLYLPHMACTLDASLFRDIRYNARVWYHTRQYIQRSMLQHNRITIAAEITITFTLTRKDKTTQSYSTQTTHIFHTYYHYCLYCHILHKITHHSILHGISIIMTILLPHEYYYYYYDEYYYYYYDYCYLYYNKLYYY